jgi:hypothetical protein
VSAAAGEDFPTPSSLLANWRERYGTAICELSVGDGALSGWVVAPKQRAEAHAWAAERGLSTAVVCLSDFSVPPPLGFGESDRVVALYREPGADHLSTERNPGEGPVRLLAQQATAVLVQCDDGTLGWCQSAEWREAATPSSWPPLPHAPAGTPVCQEAPPLARLEEFARGMLGVPYVLGGRSRERLDCSGFTSLAMRTVAGVIVPRHSTDQLQCGVRVSKTMLAPGDWVFARMRTRGVAHVGILLENGIFHASQRHGMLVCESLDAFFEHYAFMGARRFFAPN